MNSSKFNNKYVESFTPTKYGNYFKQTLAIIFFMIGFTIVLTYFRFNGTIPEKDYLIMLPYILGIALAAPVLNFIFHYTKK